MYHAEAVAYADALTNELVAAGECKAIAECTSQERVKFAAGGMAIGEVKTGGVVVSVYRVPDNTVALALESRAKQVKLGLPPHSAELHLYSSAHGAAEQLLRKIQL